MFCNRKIIFIVFLSFILFPELVSASAIGASPASISFSNMLRDGYAETYITVSNPSDERIGVRIGADGDIKNWLIYEPNRTILEPGGYGRIKIIAKPPSYQPNGIYDGIIFVVSESPSASSNETSGSLAVAVIGIVTSIQITDNQIENFTVERVTVLKTEECRDIVILSWIRNTGNIKVKPRIHIDVLDQSGNVTLKSFDQSDKEILPTTTEMISSSFSSELAQYKCIPVGIYKVVYEAYLGDKLKFRGTYLLEIVPRGTLSLKGELLSLSAKETALMGETIKVTGVFRNLGEIPVDAKLKLEVYLGGILTSVVEGETLEVLMGEDKELTAYFMPLFFGNYTITGSVIFSGKQSNTKEISIDVAPNILLYAFIVILVGAIAFLLLKRMKRKKRKKR